MWLLTPSLCWVWGQHWYKRYGELVSGRPGSKSRAKILDGFPGNRRDPVYDLLEQPDKHLG